MRLFIGISFPQDINIYLNHLQESLRTSTIKSVFTHIDHFHMTLVFLGELEEKHIDTICVMLHDQLKHMKSFQITLGDLDVFKKGKEYIVWMGLDHGQNKLKSLAQSLHVALKKLNLIKTDFSFKAHITLARKVVFKTEPLLAFQEIRKTFVPIDTVTLYQSHRVFDQLTYTPICVITL